MTPEEERLELYKTEIEYSKVWGERALRLLALEIGARMRSPATNTSDTQRAHVLDNAKWIYAVSAEPW